MSIDSNVGFTSCVQECLMLDGKSNDNLLLPIIVVLRIKNTIELILNADS